jgi:hypothetical protein
LDIFNNSFKKGIEFLNIVGNYLKKSWFSILYEEVEEDEKKVIEEIIEEVEEENIDIETEDEEVEE